MNEKKVLKVIDENNKEIEYEILLAFYWGKTNKNYIAYTDNTIDENGDTNTFAAIYYPEDETRLDSIETEEEWEQIEIRLKNM